MLFFDWLAHRNIETLLQLLEGTDYFDPQKYNSAFVAGMEEEMGRINDPAAREQIMALKDFDFGNYISRSLARSGFRGHELQDTFHDLVVKLLLRPGRLFKGWQPSKHGPLEKRFRRSVWNFIRTKATQNNRRRERTTVTDPVVLAGTIAGRQSHSSALVDQFRKLVANRLGKLASYILDWRLEGNQVKDLVGIPFMGNSISSFALKREINELKRLFHEFAIQHDDPGFLNAVKRGISGEAKTVAKRQQAMAARRQVG